MDVEVLKQALHRPTVDDLVNVLWRISQDDDRGGEQLGAIRLLAEIEGLVGRTAFHLHAHARIERPEMELTDEELERLLAKAREALPPGGGEDDGEAG